MSKTIASVTRLIDLDAQITRIRRLAGASLAIGLVLAIMGGAMIFNKTQTDLLLSADYTLCNQLGSDESCSSLVDNQMSDEKPVDRACRCRLNFTLENDIETHRVHIYYGLSNLYQNYRFLIHTRSHRQLAGDLNPRYVPKFCRTKESKTIIPCGQLANILFDDEFKIAHSGGSTLPLDRYNIAIKESRGFVFKNPGNFNIDAYTKPARWTRDLYSLDQRQQSNNALEYGPLIVWMTVSTFNDFYKLYAILRPLNNRLEKGVYTVDVDYRYGVHLIHGKKFIKIETLGSFGPRNDNLIATLACLSVIYIALSLFIACVVLKRWAYFVQVPGHVL